MLKVKITSVDKYGFLGREFHPSESDVGCVARVVFARTESVIDDHGGFFEELSVKNLTDLIEADSAIMVFDCITEDGRKLTLVEHEIEVIK